MARKKSTDTIEADAIMDAYLKSGKSLDEIMTFLKP